VQFSHEKTPKGKEMEIYVKGFKKDSKIPNSIQELALFQDAFKTILSLSRDFKDGINLEVKHDVKNRQKLFVRGLELVRFNKEEQLIIAYALED
jgi:hypothetical protein